jgi:hypothetical protein
MPQGLTNTSFELNRGYYTGLIRGEGRRCVCAAIG